MSRKKFAVLSFVALIAVSSGPAFALEDGWYHPVEVQQPCGMIDQAVIYVEGDKPISGTVTSNSVTAENPKKITATKTIMTFSGSNLRIEAEFTKRKNNMFDVKIVNGSNCNGAKLTFAK